MAKQRNSAKSGPARKRDGSPPAPFKRPPEVLKPFIETLDEKHVYIAHVDSKPRRFKKEIFTVPVLINLAVASLFAWRLYYMGPYYLRLLTSTLGYANETTLIAQELDWQELVVSIAKRALIFMCDLLLFVFIWPWPVTFVVGDERGSPVFWRWRVGFRDREVIVRRSRKWYGAVRDAVLDADGQTLFMSKIGVATAPMYLGEKTGYLTMNADWDLDWAAMVDATSMVDKNMAAIEAFHTVVLVFREEYGWLAVDLKMGDNAEEDTRRRQVFQFRDALTAVGKEDLFFRWIEIVQFEASQPGGFGPERQVEVAQRIRDLFDAEGINFDEFWKESVGTDTMV